MQILWRENTSGIIVSNKMMWSLLKQPLYRVMVPATILYDVFELIIFGWIYQKLCLCLKTQPILQLCDSALSHLILEDFFNWFIGLKNEKHVLNL